MAVDLSQYASGPYANPQFNYDYAMANPAQYGQSYGAGSNPNAPNFVNQGPITGDNPYSQDISYLPPGPSTQGSGPAPNGSPQQQQTYNTQYNPQMFASDQGVQNLLKWLGPSYSAGQAPVQQAAAGSPFSFPNAATIVGPNGQSVNAGTLEQMYNAFGNSPSYLQNMLSNEFNGAQPPAAPSPSDQPPSPQAQTPSSQIPQNQSQYLQWLQANYPNNPSNAGTPESPGPNFPGTQTPQSQLPVQTPNGSPSNTPPGPGGSSYPSFPSWGTQGGFGNYPYAQGDPGYMASSEANRAADYGNLFQQNFGNAYVDATNQANGYQQQANDAYGQLWQTPGYTDQQTQDILTGGTPGGLGAYNVTPDQLQTNFLTQQEQQGMTGNPNAVTQAYDPTTIGQTLQPGQNFATGNFQTQLANANAALGTSAANNAATLGTYGANLRGIVNNPNLQMSDQQVQQMADIAGRNVGLQYGAAQDQMQRQAEAAGNVNPLALEAARQSLLRSQSIDQADATSAAQLSALQAQRAQATQVAGMQTGAESDIANAGLATNLSQAGLATGTAGQFGSTGSTLGTNLAAENLNAGQFAGTTAISQAQYVDQAAQQRAAQIAQNRQATSQANQAANYQQGYYTNQANSSRYTGIAGQAIQGQQAARNYWQGQGQYQGGQANQAANQQISGAQTNLSGMAAGANTAANVEGTRRAYPLVSTTTGYGPGGAYGSTKTNVSGVLGGV